MPGASRSIVVNTSRERLFAVIGDYERYADFLPEVNWVKVVRREGDTVDVQYEVNVIKKIHYTLRMKEEKPARVTWTFVEGEIMKDNRGQWVLEDLGGGKTKATYTIEMAVGPLVPKAIINALVETSLPKMLEAFRQRAESSKA